MVRGTLLPHGEIYCWIRCRTLIDPNSGQWDEQLINECLWAVDAKGILSIPLAQDQEDIWAWHYDPKGLFSVKSAYKVYQMLKEPRGSSSTGTTSSKNSKFSWNAIWSAPCPPNVRQFLWRIAHDSLPHRASIARRGVPSDPLCQVCRRLDDDGAHTFLRCKGVRQVWRQMGLEEQRCKLLLCEGPKEMIQSILALEQNVSIKIISLLWNWWKSRNKINAGEEVLKVEVVAASIARCAVEYGEFFCPQKAPSIAASIRWEVPPPGMIKINFDGAFDAASGSAGWGFVCRDSGGNVVGAAAGRIRRVRDALHAEALACSYAIKAATDWGMSELIFESDCQVLVAAITSDDYDSAAYGMFFRQIKENLFVNFSSTSVLFRPRTCNKVADKLAAFGARLEGEHCVVWQGETPACVLDLVANDLALGAV